MLYCIGSLHVSDSTAVLVSLSEVRSPSKLQHSDVSTLRMPPSSCIKMSLNWLNRQLLDWRSFTKMATMGSSTFTKTLNRSTLSYGKEYKKNWNRNGFANSLIWASSQDVRSMMVLVSTRLPASVIELGSLQNFLILSSHYKR